MNRIVTSGRLVRNVSPILYRSMSILYDDKQGLMFRIPIERGTEYARIHYELTNGVYNLLHTEVPEIYRGLGHGKAVAKVSFFYCWFSDCDFFFFF